MILQEQNRSGKGYLEPTLLPAQEGDVLELDEVWSFVQNKGQQVWIWLALCRRTRQIVAWTPGWMPQPRSSPWCENLWRKIPDTYKNTMCYSDLWDAYQKVIPSEQHQACPKQEGQTNHIERFNLTLRQSVSRLVRKSLSFSKDYFMHLVHLRHFLVAYNRKKAKEYRLRLARQNRLRTSSD